jgi:hypothetical protein
LQAIVASCTDAGGIDPFVAIAAGRSWFRYTDLIELAELVNELQRKA